MRVPFALGRLDRMGWVVLGLLVGCGAMIYLSLRSLVLAYRVSQRQFTNWLILVTIALSSVLLGWARSLLG